MMFHIIQSVIILIIENQKLFGCFKAPTGTPVGPMLTNFQCWPYPLIGQ